MIAARGDELVKFDYVKPAAYELSHADWSNATEVAQQHCGLPGIHHRETGLLISCHTMRTLDNVSKQIALSAYKGKIVLLDFWTTWCPPCRADAPALDKLYSSYGGKNLMIVSVSVSEERKVVEKFLQEHPHRYPVVLTSENQMPKAYQIGAFPTYIVIGTDGNLVTATEGEKGFSSLRKMLRKAGLETE
jgi:thiol-disulfide isomerase/thioredoxin